MTIHDETDAVTMRAGRRVTPDSAQPTALDVRERGLRLAGTAAVVGAGAELAHGIQDIHRGLLRSNELTGYVAVIGRAWRLVPIELVLAGWGVAVVLVRRGPLPSGREAPAFLVGAGVGNARRASRGPPAPSDPDRRHDHAHHRRLVVLRRL